jgi:hypothetical protein
MANRRQALTGYDLDKLAHPLLPVSVDLGGGFSVDFTHTYLTTEVEGVVKFKGEGYLMYQKPDEPEPPTPKYRPVTIADFKLTEKVPIQYRASTNPEKWVDAMLVGMKSSTDGGVFVCKDSGSPEKYWSVANAATYLRIEVK